MTIQFIDDWTFGGRTYERGDIATFAAARETHLVTVKRNAVYCALPSGAPVPAPVVVESGASHNITADEAGSYLRFTAAGAKTCTWRPNSTHGLPLYCEHHIANRSASGDVTLTAGAGVTLNAPSGGTLVVEPGMTVTVKQAGVNVFDVMGQTNAA